MPKETPAKQQINRRQRRWGRWKYFLRSREAEGLRHQVIEALQKINFDGSYNNLITKLQNGTSLYELSYEEQHAYITTCLQFTEGEELAELFELWPPEKYAVQVIPYGEAEIVDGRLDISPHLEKGRFLKIKIQPTSKTTLQAQLQFTIARYLKHAKDRPKRTRIPFDPKAIKRKGRTVVIDLFQPIKPTIEHIARMFTKRTGRGPKLDDGDTEYIWEEYQKGKTAETLAREYACTAKEIYRILSKFKKAKHNLP